MMFNIFISSVQKEFAKTAARDLGDLVEKGVLAHQGSGRGTHYVLVWNRDKNGTNGTDASSKKMGH